MLVVFVVLMVVVVMVAVPTVDMEVMTICDCGSGGDYGWW